MSFKPKRERITKSKIRSMIKEELQKILSEQPTSTNFRAPKSGESDADYNAARSRFARGDGRMKKVTFNQNKASDFHVKMKNDLLSRGFKLSNGLSNENLKVGGVYPCTGQYTGYVLTFTFGNGTWAVVTENGIRGTMQVNGDWKTDLQEFQRMTEMPGIGIGNRQGQSRTVKPIFVLYKPKG